MFALKLVWGFVNLLRTALKRHGGCKIKSMEDYVSIARKYLRVADIALRMKI